MPSATVYVSLVLLFHLTSMEAKCGKQCYCFIGDQIEIPCGITGTCSWPLWMKGNVKVTNEGHSDISPTYAARYSIDTDNRTLIIINVEKSDAGRYRCFHPNGPNSPEAVEVIVEEPFDACVIKITILGFVLLLIVVIVIHCVILIRTYQECKQNEDKLKEKTKSTSIRKNVVHTVVSKPILNIAVVTVFITESVCFIVILSIEEDCEKLTKKKHSFYVYLLVVEIIVLGFINGLVYICLVMKRKNFRGYCKRYTKDTSDNHVTGGVIVSIEDNEVPNTEELLKELEKEGKVNDNAREVIEPDHCLSGIPEPTGGDHSPAEQTYFIE